MNLVGKIFVVLILVMSLVFMGFAVSVYSTHKDWPQIAKDQQQKLQNASRQYQELQEKFERLQQEIQTQEAARRNQLAKLESEKESLKTERDQLAQQEAALNSTLRERTAALATAQSLLNDKLQQMDSLRDEINMVMTERDNTFKQVVALTDQMLQLDTSVKRLESTNSQLVQQVARYKTVMDRAGLSPESAIAGGPPKVDGVILATSSDGLVEISLGSDDGIQRGHTLEVFRYVDGAAGKYLGRIEVLHSHPDRAVARIIPEFRKGSIEKDDRVATRLF